MSRKAILVPVVILIAALALLLTLKGRWNFWEGESADQKTDDATLRSDVTPLSTRVTGTVKRVAVTDYEHVHSGQTLVEIESTDYDAVLGEAEAALAGAQGELQANQDAKRILEETITSLATSVDQAQAALEAARAGVAAVQGDVARAEADRKRQESLLAVKATTKQQFDAASAEAGRFSGTLAAHQADVARAEGALAQARTALIAQKGQRATLNTKDTILGAQIKAKQSAIEVAKVNVRYTTISAPTEGVVGERHVRLGQLVPAGMQVIDLVQTKPWVQANFKETQMQKIRIGDAADVRVDSIPNHVFHGHVSGLAPASGSQFALLPPDNATGNYTKVIQRIPVKIDLDDGQDVQNGMIAGLSVVVTVHTAELKGR